MRTANSDSVINDQSPIPVNPDLVWDYDIPDEAAQTLAFRRWYIARVLTRGRSEDLKAIGLDMIYRYFPNLNLPAEIYQFWKWYLNLPEVKQRYGNPHAFADSNAENYRANSVT